jgi:hypothetical protein
MESPPRQAPPFREGETTAFDWSARLSIETIRSHTKTDDIPAVTDEQLSLYRAAALEAAEFYTGHLLSCQKTVIEPIEAASPSKMSKAVPLGHQALTYRYELRYPVADGLVYLYCGSHPNDNRVFRVPTGSRVIRVPITTGFLDMSNCCDPCAKHQYNSGMMAAYKAGYQTTDAVPSGIVLGCLQYLAWVVEHPGDELVTQRNRKDNSTKVGGVSGSNNIAMVSGALETWRQYDESAI